ncbi:MAG: response regulator [Kiloniellales bacterium]
MRILFIDDEALVREHFAGLLGSAGYEVVVALDGEEGIAALESEPFDLVICDILMPKKEGMETIFEIRKRKLARWVIAISGGGLAKNMKPLQLAKKAGADVILAKPVGREAMLDAIRSLTSKSALVC